MSILKQVSQGYKRGFGQVLDDRTPFLGNFVSGSTVPETVGYGAGRVIGDFVTDASRTPYWRYNAPQALTNEMGQKLGQSAGLTGKEALIAGAALTGVLELSTGNVNPFNLAEAGRPKGYSSLFPKEIEVTDPETGEVTRSYDLTKSRNPIAELPARYFLGRTGNLLPYELFAQERPDVTPEEYARYQAARRDKTFFGLEDAHRGKSTAIGTAIGGIASAATRGRIDPRLSMPAGAAIGLGTPDTADAVSDIGLLRGTADGLNGPEVEFFGYRIPLAQTAIAGGLAASGMYAGAKALKSGRAQQLVNRVSRKAGMGNVMQPVEYQQELDFTYGGPRAASEIPKIKIEDEDFLSLIERNRTEREAQKYRYQRMQKGIDDRSSDGPPVKKSTTRNFYVPESLKDNNPKNSDEVFLELTKRFRV